MKRLLTSASLLAVLATPAWAIADQDNSAISQYQAQHQTQNATSSSTAKATSYGSQQHQNAYGGQGGAGGRGGAGGSATGGAGGIVNVYNTTPASGSGTQAAAPLASPAAAQAAPAASGASYSYSGGDTHVVAPPSIANVLQPASGDDCPGVGIGGGGSAQTGAGLLSYTWEGPHCVARRDAKLLIEMGHPLAAEYVLSQANDEVRKGLEWEAKYLPAAPVAPVQAEPFIVGFCRDNPSMCDGGE